MNRYTHRCNATRLTLGTLAAVLIVVSAAADNGDAGSDIPVSGFGLPNIDTAVRRFMAEHNVPGIALAIGFEDRLVVARGYGTADIQSGETVQPDSLFRLASVSKPITAVAAMTLSQSGYLNLEAPALPRYLPDLFQFASPAYASEIATITTADLLNHISGWQFRRFGQDMVFNDRRIARAMQVPSPPGPENVIRYVLQNEPLHDAPGNAYQYDNFNFMVAGRIIESVARRPYEDYVRSRVFAPLGISSARVGFSLAEQRLPGEVRYYTRGSDARTLFSVFDESGGIVPTQYGGWDQQSLDSVGGWVASAPDLVRLLAALDARPGSPDLLTTASLERMGRNPGPPIYSQTATQFYALGWGRDDNGNVWNHDGSLPGTRAFIVILESGLKIAALINTREIGPAENAFDDGFGQALLEPILGGPQWPEHDLFTDLGYEQFVVTDEISGAWYDPSHDGEGFLVEVLNAEQAVVYWFTYDAEGNQRWFVGTGQIDRNRIEVSQLLEPVGGRFGAQTNDITTTEVGHLTLTFDHCDAGVSSYTVDGVAGTQSLSRITRINGSSCLMPGDSVDLVRDAERASSGSWFDVNDPGEGFIVQRLSDDQAAMFWFTFDLDGAQRWMTGVGASTANGWQFEDVVITEGGRFGADFEPADVARTAWGDVTIELGCQEGAASYSSEHAGFSSGNQSLTRLTFLAGQSCL